MTLVSLIVILILVGVGLYLINQITMDPKVKTIINVVVILVLVLWLLQALNLLGPINTIKIN